MQRASPRKRKQVFPQGSPPESPSKDDSIRISMNRSDLSSGRRIVRDNPQTRRWEEDRQIMKDERHVMFKDGNDDESDKLEAVDHVEEVEEMEEEEDVEVDDPVEEEVIEEYVDDFNIPLYAEEAHMIHASGKSGGVRRYARDYAGGTQGGYAAVPRIHDGNVQFGGQIKRQIKYRENMANMGIPGPLPRPPVHLRTTEAVAQQHRTRLLPVAIARPSGVHRFGMGYGGHNSTAHWREDQKRKMELLDIYESLPVRQQVNFLNYLNSTGETFIPPSQNVQKGRRSGEGVSTITRMRTLPNEMDHQQHTVEVPAQLARGGGEILISPMPDGRNRIMSLIPVGDEESVAMRKSNDVPKMKKRKEEGEEGEGREGEEEVVVEEEEVDTSDMPLLEADKEALEKRKESRRRGEGEGGEGEWNGLEEDVDVENVDDGGDRRIDDGVMEEEEDGGFPMIPDHSMRGISRRGLFYVPELDGYPYERYAMCAPKMKGGLRLCESCNIYMRKSVFYHHQRTIREHGSCSAMTPKRFECGVPDCEEKLPTIERLCVHMAEHHNMPTDVQETEFQNEDEFQAFLVELESKGGNFRMSRGNKCGKMGVVRYYRCNRVSNKERGRPRKSIADMEDSMNETGDSSILEMDGVQVEGRKRKQALVRTEKICTAFYRKAEGIDGRISVRYCDFHLHEDVRVKLPEAVKERIMQMLAKKLPMPVIVEVIKAESEQYARLGSELERRVYAIGEKDVRNVYCTYLARKRKEEHRGIEEDLIPDLNETEAKFLRAFEKAEGKSIHEVAKGSKITLERRRRRDFLRERMAHIQSFFKSDRFIEFSDAQLSKLEGIFGTLTEMLLVEKAPKIDMVEDIMEEDIEEEEGEREEGGTDTVEDDREGDTEGGDRDDNQPSTSNNTGETPTVRKRGRPRKHPLTVEEALRLEEEREKKRAEREEKEEMEGVPKEEELEEDLIRSPIVTSRGRLTKPKKFDDY